MSESPLSPSAWIQQHLTALFHKDDVQDAIDQMFSPSCEVRLNHETHPLETFKDDLASRRAMATRVGVAWNRDIISTNDYTPEEPTVVAGAFVVIRILPFRVRTNPVKRLTYVYFSAKIERDTSVQDGDQRRVTSFHYMSVDRTPTVPISALREAQTESE